MMCCIITASAYVLVRTDPVVWKMSNKMAFGQRVEFKVLLLYLNPCKEFDSHSNSAPHSDAKKQCQSLFQTEWVDNVKAIARIGSRNRSVVQPMSQINQQPKTALEKRESKKVLRQVFTGLATAVFCYQIITNLVSYVVGPSVSPHMTVDNTNLDHAVFKYEHDQSAITDVISKVVENMNFTDKDLHELKKRYDESWGYHDQVFAMLAVLNELNRDGNRLRSIIEKAQVGKMALKEIAHFMSLNGTSTMKEAGLSINLFDINIENTEFINAFEVGDKGLHLHFAIMLSDPDTDIYEIESFNYWNMQQYPPELMTYVGERFVIYNKKLNCKRAVLDSSSIIVTEKCHKIGYTDPKLNKWLVISGNMSTFEPQIIQTKYFNYVYCYPNNITFNNHTQHCPPAVLK